MNRTLVATLCSVLAAGCLMPVVVTSQETPAAAPAAQAPDNRTLRTLRADVRKAERRFQSLYEELNEDSDQGVECEDSASTGTRFRQRSCSTRSAASANALAARDYLADSDRSAGLSRQQDMTEAQETGGALAAPVAGIDRQEVRLDAQDLSAQRDAYVRNLQQLAARHPELGQRYQEYVQAQQRLEAAEKQRRDAR